MTEVRPSESTWYLFEDLEQELDLLDEGEHMDRASRILGALSETAGDVVRSGRRTAALNGAELAKHALDHIRVRYADRNLGPAFIAGRLAALTDILAITASKRASDDITNIARRMLTLLRAIYAGATSNKAIAETLQITEETACRWLREAREAGLVDAEREGRKVVNRLSDLALALDDQSIVGISSEAYSMASILASTPPAKEPPKRKEGLPQLQVTL